MEWKGETYIPGQATTLLEAKRRFAKIVDHQPVVTDNLLGQMAWEALHRERHGDVFIVYATSHLSFPKL